MLASDLDRLDQWTVNTLALRVRKPLSAKELPEEEGINEVDADTAGEPLFIGRLSRGTRPGVGRKPTTPHHVAGFRRLPPVSEPCARGSMPVANAAPAPPASRPSSAPAPRPSSSRSGRTGRGLDARVTGVASVAGFTPARPLPAAARVHGRTLASTLRQLQSRRGAARRSRPGVSSAQPSAMHGRACSRHRAATQYPTTNTQPTPPPTPARAHSHAPRRASTLCKRDRERYSSERARARRRVAPA